MTERPSTRHSIAKIDRADQNIVNLEELFRRFIDRRPYEVIADVDPNPNTRTRRIISVEEVPLDLRVLVGEIAHHLRSSFDVLVHQLMLQANATETELENCAFPVIVNCDVSTPKGAHKYESDLGRKIQAIRRTPAGALIEGLQPCHLSHGADSPLAQIDQLNRIDKHRLLLALVGGIPIAGWNFPGGITTVPAGSFVPLARDTYVKWDAKTPEVNVDLKWPTPIEITFGEKGPFNNKAVIPTLQQLSDFSRRTISEFSRFFS